MGSCAPVSFTVSICVQGNFFQNIGSITLFAVIGTAISAFIVGGGIYFLGQVRESRRFYQISTKHNSTKKKVQVLVKDSL